MWSGDLVLSGQAGAREERLKTGEIGGIFAVELGGGHDALLLSGPCRASRGAAWAPVYLKTIIITLAE